MVPFERVLVSSYRPFIVTFPLSLCVSEILPLLCSSTPPFLTPPLVFPQNFPMFMAVGGWPLGHEQKRCWTNCPCNLFPRFPTYVILMIHRHKETDIRHAINCMTMLCTIVHRAVKRRRALYRMFIRLARH